MQQNCINIQLRAKHEKTYVASAFHGLVSPQTTKTFLESFGLMSYGSYLQTNLLI